MRMSLRMGFSLLTVVAVVAVLGGTAHAQRPPGGNECTGSDIGGLAYSHILAPKCAELFEQLCPNGTDPCPFDTEIDFLLVLLPTTATVDSAYWEIDGLGGGTFWPVPAGGLKDSTGSAVTFPFNNPGAGGISNTEIPLTADVTDFDETLDCNTFTEHLFDLRLHVTSTGPNPTTGSTSSFTRFTHQCVPEATIIPTVTEWGVVILAALLLVAGGMLLVRRRREA